MRDRDVSVVVPTYGRQAMVERAVQSVLAAGPDADVVVVDDASPEPIRAPSGARVVRLAENQGVAAARNAGVEASDRPVVAFLDSDDWWLPGRLTRTLPALDRAPVVLCWSAYGDVSRPSGRLLEGDVSDVIADDVTPHVGVTTVLREAFVPFDESFRTCQDIEWWVRLAAAARVTTIPEVLCTIGRHDGVRHRSGPDRRIVDSRRLLESHYFETHRRARAFRLQRIGVMAASIGDRRTAVDAQWRSLVAAPSARGVGRLARRAIGR